MRYKNKSKLRKLFAGGTLGQSSNDFVDGASSQIAEKLVPGAGVVAQAGSAISSGIGSKVADITGNNKIGKAASYISGGPAGFIKAGVDALNGNFLGKKDDEMKRKEMEEFISSVTTQGKNNYTAATNNGFKPQGNPYATMANGGKLPNNGGEKRLSKVGVPEPTKLNEGQEVAYRDWMKKRGITKEAGYELDDNFNAKDYDYRGYWKEEGFKNLDDAGKNGAHFNDKYKMLNSEPFQEREWDSLSDESKYASKFDKRGQHFFKQDKSGNFIFNEETGRDEIEKYADGGKLPEPKIGKGSEYFAVKLSKEQKAKFRELDKKGKFTLEDIDPELAAKYGNLIYTGQAPTKQVKKEAPITKKAESEVKVQAPAKKGILGKAFEKGKEIYEESKKIYNEGNKGIKPGVSYVDRKGELRTAKYLEEGASPEEDMVVTLDKNNNNGRRVRYQDILSQLPEFANGGRLKAVGGKTHENGGTPIDIDGNKVPRSQAIVEAEKGEVVDKKTDVVFSDRVKVPGTNKTFADQVMKDKKNPKKVDFLADLQVQVSEGIDETGRKYKETYTPVNVYDNKGNYPQFNQDQKPTSLKGKALQNALLNARKNKQDKVKFAIDGKEREYLAGKTERQYIDDVPASTPTQTPVEQPKERKKLFTVHVGGGATGESYGTGKDAPVKAGTGTGSYQATNAKAVDIYEGDAIPEGAVGANPEANRMLRQMLQQKKWGGKLQKASGGIQMNRRSKMDAFEKGVPEVGNPDGANSFSAGNIGKGLSKVAPFADNIMNGVLNMRRAKSISNLPQQGTTDYIKSTTVDNSKAVADIKNASYNAMNAIGGASAQNMNANKAGMLGETLDAISRTNESTANINAQNAGQANQVNAGIQAQNNAIKFQNASDRFRAKDEIGQETSKNMSNVVDKVNMQKLDKTKFELASDQQLVDLATSDPRSVAYLKANIAPDRFERLFGMPKRSIGGKLRKKYAY